MEQVHEAKYMTEEITDRTLEFVEEHQARPWPFFVFVSYTAIHTPYQAPEEYMKHYPGQPGLAMLAALDDGVGRILDQLRDLGIEDNTMVWFVGDNGGYMPDSNWKLRGYKGVHYEGGIRVPFIVSWPGRLQRGSVYKHPVMHIDFLPTVLAAAGMEQPPELDGANLLPHLTDEASEPPHDVLFWGYPERDQFVVRCGNWKLIRESPGRQGPRESALYDLSSDIGETTNVLDERKDVAGELMKRMESWREDVKQSFANAW